MEISCGTIEERIFQAPRTEISKDIDGKKRGLHGRNNKQVSLVKGT